MKRSLALALVTLLIVIVIQTQSLKLNSNSAQPLYGGLSGDPGQTTCVHCHSDITNGIPRNSQFVLKISQDSAGLVGNANIITASSTYTPDYTQWVSIQLLGQNTNAISGGYTPRQGFQFTALYAVGDSMAGSFVVVDRKTTTQSSTTSYNPAQYGPVKYMSHRNADSATSTWYFKWRAPHSGNIKFYYTGNLGNGDGTYNGDSIFVGSATLSPGAPSGINNISGSIHYASVYPVPLDQKLNAELYLNTASDVSITLLSIDGQSVRELYNGNATQGKFNKSFDIADVSAGIYFVRVQSGTDSRIIKVLKY